VTTPLSVMICHLRIGLAKIKLYTKFEVSISTYYKDMKNDTKNGKRGGLR